jgi:hypothetical protein
MNHRLIQRYPLGVFKQTKADKLVVEFWVKPHNQQKKRKLDNVYLDMEKFRYEQIQEVLSLDIIMLGIR